MTGRFGATLLALVLAACSGATGAPTADPDALHVVTTTTVHADLVARVGGPNVRVTSVVPKGGEVHTFDPSPGDVTTIAGADLIVVNGLGLDEWLADLARDAGTEAPIVELGEDIGGVEYIVGGHDEPDAETHDEPAGGDDHGAINPHLWLNVSYARAYVQRIADTLAAVDPANAAGYGANAAAYDAELDDLDREIRARVDTIPLPNRKLVSFHEAFPYFADAYGLEIVGVIVDAPGQDPSAGDIGALVDAIRESGAKAVFGEAQFSDKLVRTIAEETGAKVESRLYSDSLGDPPVDTYVGMMRWNTERIVEALR